MLNFFDSIVNFFEILFNLIGNILSSISVMLTTIKDVIRLPGTLLPVLPGVLGSAVLIVFSVGIVKLIIGWGNS